MRSTVRDAHRTKNQSFPQVVSPKSGEGIGYPAIGQNAGQTHRGPKSPEQLKNARPSIGSGSIPQIRKTQYNMNFSIQKGSLNNNSAQDSGGPAGSTLATDSKFGSKRQSNS